MQTEIQKGTTGYERCHTEGRKNTGRRNCGRTERKHLRKKKKKKKNYLKMFTLIYVCLIP